MVKVKEDLTGRRFGRLVVVTQAEDHIRANGTHVARWWCQCDCGSNPKAIVGYDLNRENGIRSCGCIRTERPNGRAKTKENLIGQRFGRLVVVSRADDYITKQGKHEVQWNCLCDCGNMVVVRGYALKRGTSQSCGCLAKELKSERAKRYNTYDLSGNYGVGYTSNGDEFWFDKEDYELIKDYCWHYGTGGYLLANTSNKDKPYIQFHRLVMGVSDQSWTEVIIDHKVHGRMNEHKYDNRKENLRLVNRAQNNQNAHIRKDNTSGFKGVSWNEGMQKWQSVINVNGKSIHLGSFIDKDAAIQARINAEKKYFGEYDFNISQQISI
jgi:hypothetical protein